MADDKTLTEDDDIEIVEVEQLPKPGETAAVEDKSEDEDEDDAPEEDARLVADDDEDDDAEDKDTPAHKKRVKRRQLQKQARDRTLTEVARLREQNAAYERRLAALETSVVTQSETQVDERLTKTRDDIAMADRIMAKALEAGNGDDFVAAQNMRDAAKTQEFELLRTKGNFTDVKKNTPDQRVVSLSNEWKSANASWYGADANATQVANQIDSQVAADGYNPSTPAYWQELSRRLQSRFQASETTAPTKKKTPPPQGQTREHTPPSTRREVYVTPERKQAMIDAGKWDDPVARAKMLKAYAQYDREQSAS